jgi:hypothetical protein
MDEQKNKAELAQPTHTLNGDPVSNYFRPMWWDKKESKPKPASVMYDLAQAIKNYIGEEAYEAAKKKNNGLNINFFKGQKFEAEVNAGTSKDGNDYYFVKLPSQALISDWKYIAEYKGDMEYEDIQAVRDAFPNIFDNSKQVEEAFSKKENDNDPYATPF